MTKLFAFLRAVNVGGRTVRMAEVCRLFELTGATDVTSFLASGNIIFNTRARNMTRLAERLETELENALGYGVDVFLRTGEEIRSIAEDLPFDQATLERAGAFNVGLLTEPLDAAGRAALKTLESQTDQFAVCDRHICWLCTTKVSESTLSNASFERTLGVRPTFRTINTFRRLVAKFVDV